MNSAQRRAFAEATKRVSKNSRKPKSNDDEFEPWEVVVLYHLAVAVAAWLTLTCPVVDDNDESGKQSAATRTVAWDGTAWKVYHLVEVALLLGTISLSFFVLHGSDPGWLTPAVMEKIDDGVAAEQDKDDITTSATSLPSSNNPRRREWCRVCRLAPPLRAHHCRHCRRCVATFDHHCEFVGTCIGERNRCRFWWFLLAQVAGVSRCCMLLVLQYHQSHHADNTTTNKNSLWFRVLRSWHSLWRVRRYGRLLRLVAAHGYVLVLAVAVTFLFVVHTGMAVTNSTTFELGKSRHLAYYKYCNNNGIQVSIKPYHFPFHQGTVRRNLQIYGCGMHLQWLPLSTGKSDHGSRPSWKPILWEPPMPRVPVSARKLWWKKWKGKD